MTNEEWTKKFADDWFEAGRAAYFAGQPREAPFDLISEAWLVGWDTGAMQIALKLGANAPLGALCHYADPTLAAVWRRGYTAVHGLRVITGSKKPGPASATPNRAV